MFGSDAKVVLLYASCAIRLKYYVGRACLTRGDRMIMYTYPGSGNMFTLYVYVVAFNGLM